MSRITAIEPQKRAPHRVSIYLDGHYAFGLDRLVAAWLRVGQDLDEGKIAALQAQDACERAYQQAVLFLSFRPRSEAEIRRNLRRHAFAEAVIEQTLERLRAEHLADDRRFARAWVENRTAFRPRSRRALASELYQKGLSEESVQSALSEVDEEALAYAAASKKARHLKGVPHDQFCKKLSQFLARRGFSYSIIAPILSRLWDEMHVRQHSENEESL